MRILKFLAILIVPGLLMIGCSTEDEMNNSPVKTTLKGGDLVGAHYNLNIIGVKDKTAEMDGSNGHVIFVPIEGATAIWLTPGEFQVLDANGTDADGAKFQLPDPGLDPYIVGEKGDADVISDYSVYVRPLGKPGGFSTITTCADVLESGLAEFISKTDIRLLNRAGLFGGVASVEQVGSDITMRTKGKTPWTNVTAELLTIVLKVQYDDDGDGVIDDDDPIIFVRVPIFNDLLENEYWEYDNKGLKLLQVRFYPWGTDVSEDDLLLQ